MHWCRNAKNRWCHGGNGSIAVSASHFPVQACASHTAVRVSARWGRHQQREAPHGAECFEFTVLAMSSPSLIESRCEHRHDFWSG